MPMPIDYMTRPGQFADRGKSGAHRYVQWVHLQGDAHVMNDLDYVIPLLDRGLDADAPHDLDVIREKARRVLIEETS